MTEQPLDPPPVSGNASQADSPRLGPVTKFLWAVMVLAMVGVVVAKLLEPRPRSLPVLYHQATFNLIDENGNPFGDSNLRSKPYLCDFIFTTCGSVCPMMSAKMRELQNQTPANVQLVSFTVDPQHDTPAVLKDYAARFAADLSRWHFLTGTPDQMYKVAREMKLVAVPATTTEPIMHDEHFMLIDVDGNVRGIYASNEPAEMKQLLDDAKYVARSGKGHG